MLPPYEPMSRVSAYYEPQLLNVWGDAKWGREECANSLNVAISHTWHILTISRVDFVVGGPLSTVGKIVRL